MLKGSLLSIPAFLVIIALAPNALAQGRGCELKPTLEAYMTERHGDPSRTIWPMYKGTPECQKLNFDNSALACQLGKAQDEMLSNLKMARTMKDGLERARKQNHRRLGSDTTGPPAKARQIRRYMSYLARDTARYHAAKLRLESTLVAYRGVSGKQEAVGCDLRKPWEPKLVPSGWMP